MRLDYQSFDTKIGCLYMAHLGDDTFTGFDTVNQKVAGDAKLWYTRHDSNMRPLDS